MSRITAAIEGFLVSEDWSYHPVPDKPILQMSYNGNNAQWTCYTYVSDEKEQFTFYSLCPVKVPSQKLANMAEFLTRANYGIAIGNFEMDFSDGEIRYKTSIDVEGTEINTALIKPLVYANVLTMDRYLPGIMAVISGDVAPEAAIQKIEGS